MSYESKIYELYQPTFQDIRDVAMSEIRPLSDERRNELYNSLVRGTALLNTNEQMCQYLWSFGNMHEAKMKEVLSHLPMDLLENQSVQVIDWGCGQGLATVCLFDFLRSNNINLDSIKRVVLIEPSKSALDRAKIHIESYKLDNVEIITLPKYLNDVTIDDIKLNSSDVTIHFFSNILDIVSIDIKQLANTIATAITGEHYFVCVGPTNAGNKRIDAFANWFQNSQLIWDFENSDKTKNNYTAKYKIFKIERYNDETVLVPYNPPVQFHAAYALDGVRNILKNKGEKASALFGSLSSFEVSTPFDLGASIYDDVNPVLAVLNNIIVRGLPTKASPFLEKAFESLGNKEVDNPLGEIDFNIDNLNEEDIFLAMHIIDNRLKIARNDYNCEILDSDFEKTYINNIAPKVFQQILQPQRKLSSITQDNQHFAQRVDFAFEFPYPTIDNRDNREKFGYVIELDGEIYHRGEQRLSDEERTKALENKNWYCVRIKDSEIASANGNKYGYLGSEYVKNVFDVYSRNFDPDWVRNLQMALTPIAVARLEKTIVEALLINKLDISKPEWNILVQERDVPCAALAFEELKLMFVHLTSLSQKYSDWKFPKVNLTIITTDEFKDSPLHKIDDKGIHITVLTEVSGQVKTKGYDMIVDISVLRRAGFEDISFSDFTCQNDCYFNIRSAHYKRSPRQIYTSDVIDYKPLVNRSAQGEYVDIKDRKEHLEYFMQMLFRKKSFRSGQLPILSRALQNQCVIGLLPTGGGKSLTYQIAAMLQPGVTIVVDPLRSLMKDQFDGLLKAGIDTCSYVNSAIQFPTELENASDAKKKAWKEAFNKKDRNYQNDWMRDEREKRCSAMEKSQLQFMFLSPERLGIYNFRERLKNMHELGVYFSYGVIDEVHCVSEWGHDFRFTYLHLGRNLYNYVLPKQTETHSHITLFGLTATASFDVLADVERELSGNGQFELDSNTIVRDENTNRLELQYKIEKVPVEYEIDKFYDKNHKLYDDLPKAVNITDKFSAFESKHEYLKSYISKIPVYLNELQSDASMETITERFFERQNKPRVKTEDLHVEMPDDYAETKDEYQQAGIVFCPHKNNTGISVNSNAESISKQMLVGTFMGSSDEDDEELQKVDEESFRNLELFRNNKQPLMIATKAFGMGIDKPNVRFTINMNYSSSLESFVQEAGRSGRDRHMALSVILLSDYKLVRINQRCQENRFPMMIIRNKWFKENDLQTVINRYRLNIADEYIDTFTPAQDMVKLRCEVCPTRFAFGKCGENCQKCNKNCQDKCIFYDQCKLRLVPNEAKGFQFVDDLKYVLSPLGLSIPAKNLEYLNFDYDTNMFFYNNNFKGSLVEKRTMYELLNKSTIPIFIGNDLEIKDTFEVSDFLKKVLNSNVGTEIVAFVDYKEIVKYDGQLAYVTKSYKVDQDNKEVKKVDLEFIETHNSIKEIDRDKTEEYRTKSDVAKAVYRMCCISFIDDFTEDYGKKAYRIVTVRKPDGEYYNCLQKYLERYYSEEKAAEEIAKVPDYKGENEVHKCLGYLTEFIYDKIAVKRKRAIDDIRTFCLMGIENEQRDWKETNEELKDFIYYYFNSKYARQDFSYPNLNEEDKNWSLTNETQNGKHSSFDLVLKYMRVVNDDITSQDSSAQIDNVKHLQGAVRLIRRSLTDINPSIYLLDAFCLMFLGTNNNKVLKEELSDMYINGMKVFYRDCIISGNDFWSEIFEKFNQNQYVLAYLNSEDGKLLKPTATLEIHAEELRKINEKYIK
ncbi:MAG: DEAD/DEAH box helicase [Bacteroidales bacterium]|nr:DEAD/DEAH box helicase [Bacteroidales bacterium]